MKNSIRIAGLSAAIAVGAMSLAYAGSGHGKQGGHGPHHSFEELDADGDGQITRAEMQAHKQARFDAADTDGNGSLSSEELMAKMTKHAAKRAEKKAAHMMERYDANGDGELSKEEMQARHKGKYFDKADANEDGAISAEEFAALRGKYKGHKTDGKNEQKDAE